MTTQSKSQVKRCETCGAEICYVRLPNGEGWVKADWGPLLPVVEFGRAIIANRLHDYVGPDLKPDHLSYDGFRLPGHVASILLIEHKCDAHTKLVSVWTEAGRKAMAEWQAREAEGGESPRETEDTK